MIPFDPALVCQWIASRRPMARHHTPEIMPTTFCAKSQSLSRPKRALAAIHRGDGVGRGTCDRGDWRRARRMSSVAVVCCGGSAWVCRGAGSSGGCSGRCRRCGRRSCPAGAGGSSRYGGLCLGPKLRQEPEQGTSRIWPGVSGWLAQNGPTGQTDDRVRSHRPASHTARIQS